MATLKVYNGSSWSTAVGKVYNGSAWEDQMWFHNGTAFQPLYDAGPVVAWNGHTLTNIRVGAACQANWKADNNGNKYESNNVGSNTLYQQWLISGSTSEVWLERTIVSGSLTLDTIGSGRVISTTDRKLGVTRTTSGFKNCTCTVRFYDASSGGNLLATGSLVLSAEFSL